MALPPTARPSPRRKGARGVEARAIPSRGGAGALFAMQKRRGWVEMGWLVLRVFTVRRLIDF